MDTEDELRYDEFLSQLYEEHKERAIEEFKDDRLQSYYREHPDVAQPARIALQEARELLPDHPAASLIFSAITVELGLKEVLLKPIVYGLIHDESTAGMVADLILHSQESKWLLLQILQDRGGVDLDAYTRPTQSKGLWEEYKEIKSSRNFILHRGATATVSEAEVAAQVAIAVLEDVFPTVIDSLYPLSLDGDLRIKS